VRVIATIWMQPGVAVAPQPLPAIAGGSPEADALPPPVQSRRPVVGIAAVAVICAAASIFFGIVPSPLLHLSSDAAQAISP
jgi:hypothetical protein